MAEEATPGLDALQDALDAGDIGAVRRQLLTLSEHELTLLREDIGAAAVERSLQAASRNRRGERRGKVIVLPGIMGSLLDRVDRRGDAERVWISITRLIGGGMEDLQLTVPDGLPTTPGSSVRTAGVHRGTYLPLLTELDAEWEVRPFAFDWREDMAKSATRLEAEVRAFGAGGPVHLVAHSMGGLVARYVSRHFAATWTSMDDAKGHASGGRLVMLGTPNRGSFAPALALTGVEKLVRRLALIDGDHRLPELLAILATFGGLYEMLPSPLIDLGDDHKDLFEAAAWPQPVHQALLDAAQKFQVDLHEVIDPERLVYVAGADRETPARVRTDGGRLSYEYTREGDGRVPHSLGLLERVTTYYVDEDHGDLPKNGSVLDAIHDLLATGVSTTLSSAPVRRSIDEIAMSRRARAVADDAEDAEVVALAARSRGGGQALTDQERIRLATLITEDYLGRGGGPAAPPSVARQPKAPPPVVEVDVVWGDVTKVAADMYSVGHYRGVVPQRAERALDDAISRAGIGGPRRSTATDGIIAAQTRRNGIRADVGDVEFFPWADAKHPGRVVAVAGMGSPGTFDAASLRRLVKSTAIAASEVPTVATWCSVLIGSGEGTLTMEEAVAAWVSGLADAAVGAAATGRRPPPKLVIVEMIKGRADHTVACLRKEADRLADAGGPIALEGAEQGTRAGRPPPRRRGRQRTAAARPRPRRRRQGTEGAARRVARHPRRARPRRLPADRGRRLRRPVGQRPRARRRRLERDPVAHQLPRRRRRHAGRRHRRDGHRARAGGAHRPEPPRRARAADDRPVGRAGACPRRHPLPAGRADRLPSRCCPPADRSCSSSIGPPPVSSGRCVAPTTAMTPSRSACGPRSPASSAPRTARHRLGAPGARPRSARS